MRFIAAFFILLLLSAPPCAGAKMLAQTKTQKAEDFSLEGTDGKTYTLSSYRGKVVLINFWATTCKPCIEELPSLAALSERMKGRDFVVLAVSQDKEKALKKFLAKNPLPFPVLRDTHKEVSFDLYAVFALPTTVIVDKNGYVAERIYGPRDWGSEEEIEKIEELLKRY